MKSFQIIVSGRVHGVFFRDSTRRKALELGLTGYVKNLSNGTVEIVVQGDEGKIEEIAEFVRKNPGYSKVDDVKITEKRIENFKNFEIRY